MNLIRPSQVRRGAGLVKRGVVLRLGQDFGPDTPVPRHRKSIERFMTRDAGDYLAGARRPQGFQFAEDVISFAAHSGTHIDALAHAWYDDVLYNGFPSRTVRSTTGAQRCGADKLTPLVTRGVLLDVTVGRSEPLAAGEMVTVVDLERAAAASGFEPEPGDVVLIRTGWLGRMRETGDLFEGEPGIGIDAARWLVARDVAAVGSDNYAIEAVSSNDPAVGFPVHQILLRDYGVPLIEGVVLDELADEVAKEGNAPFLFVAAPLRITGGTSSPVDPIAIM